MGGGVVMAKKGGVKVKRAGKQMKKSVAREKAIREPRTRKKKKTRLAAKVLKRFKDVLLVHKERIMGDYMNLRESHLRSSQRDSTGDLSGYSLHMADLGTDTFDRDFGLSVAANEQDFLYRIDSALKRIEDKTYGICEGCHRMIKVTRLNAIPWARMCIKCKEAEEKEGGKS
jgi:DnaK suppressor protein